jgi:hypothetical protein
LRTFGPLGDAFESGGVAAVLQCFGADWAVLYAGSEVDETAVGAG